MSTINKFVRVVLFSLCFCLYASQHASGQLAQIGIAFGSNSNKLTEVDEFTSFENASGWHIEIWFDLPFGPLAMRPGLRYVSAGSIFEVANDNDPSFQDDVNISIFEIPMDFRFRFNMQLLTPYISVGPLLRFPSGGGGVIEGMRNVNVAGGFGVGLEFNLGPVVMLYPEIKYTFGITQFTEDRFEIAQRPYTPSDNQLLNGFMMRLSVGF